MDSMGISTDDLKASFAELLATMLFVFIGVGSVAMAIFEAGAVLEIAMAHGLAIALLAAGIGPISGGHINPAVTFAMLITGRIAVPRAVLYIIAQLIGACLGVLLLRGLLSDELLSFVPGAGGHAIEGSIVTEPIYGMGIEAVMTFLLVWTIFATAVSPRGSALIAPLVIGFAVLVIHVVAVPMTGAGVNPARTFGPALLLPGAAEGVIGRWEDFWIYYIGPLIGASAAALSYWLLYLTDEEPPAA
jgi:aquaporin TIP